MIESGDEWKGSLDDNTEFYRNRQILEDRISKSNHRIKIAFNIFLCLVGAWVVAMVLGLWLK